MRFFEFNEFAYYALIGAENEELAVKTFVESVCDIEEDDGKPAEITEEEARAKYNNAPDLEEGIKDFDELMSDNEPVIILIDSSLV